ncbi:MAG: ACT domain-containing protein [Oscillospiraceae bacterium]|nr:ACT domain-containing protein [Oscillospiraceae bacterium]
MSEQGRSKYYLVSGDALPEVFIRVTQARELLDTGQAQTVAEAAERVGISRSAYYKYKNAVMPFQSVGAGRIVTFQIMLRHQMGVLSEVLGLFADTGANILTINQGIPTNGAAPVTVTADTADMEITTETLLARLEGTEGVISAAVVAG